MNKFFGHLSTIIKHKRYVRKACFKMGLYIQGITHDLSKFSPAEFWVSVKYFNGSHSPNADERRAIGYSSAWLHHQGRNKHHFEYWNDYSGQNKKYKMPIEMPVKYLAEMVADRYAACRAYNKDAYTCSDPLNYFLLHKDTIQMHENTKVQLEEILKIMAEQGEDAAFKFTKELVKRSKND